MIKSIDITDESRTTILSNGCQTKRIDIISSIYMEFKNTQKNKPIVIKVKTVIARGLWSGGLTRWQQKTSEVVEILYILIVV